MISLPENWVICTLDELIVSLESGSRPKGGVRGIESGIPSLGGEHLNYNGGFNFSSIKYVPTEFARKMTKGHIKENDILVVKDGATTGKTAFVDQNFPYKDAVVNEHVFICRPTKQIDSRYLFRFLMSQEGQKEILKNFQGSAQGGINQSFALNTYIPLAPIEEQHRILNKLERVLSKVQACQERLDKIPVILKRFRQAVLAVACSGRLTEKWREKNLVASNENIQIINNEENPVGWKVVCIGDVIESLKYGTARKCSYENKGIPILRIPNIVNGFIDQTDLKYAELSTKEFNQLRLIPGDILIIRSNGSVSLVGKSAIIREQESDFAYAGYLIRIRPNKTKIEPEFLNLSLGSNNIRLQIGLKARSTSGVNNINGDEVRALRLNLPPLKEQQEIIRQVRKYLTLADKIEARYERIQTYINKLSQSILAKAFRGELVPQDPNDEPASVLLERIRKEMQNK